MSADDTDVNQVTIDEAFSRSIGDFGRHQKWIFSLVSLPWLPGAFLTLSMSFAGKDPVILRLWECVDMNDVSCTDAFNSAVDPTAAFCALSETQWRWTTPHESIISDFSLQCDQEWKVTFANSGYFFGFLLGSSLWGMLSDAIGRRRSMMIACLTSSISAALTATVSNYWGYMLMRFITGVVTSGIGIISFVLALEIVGPSARGVAAIATQLFWAVGECLLAWVAFGLRPWRPLMLATASVTLSMLLLWPFIPESPRFLLTQGRTSESWNTLKRLADGNKTSMPANSTLIQVTSSTAKGSLMDTFRIPILRRRQMIMLYCWCVVSLGFYGVSMALDSLGGSLYVNFFLVSFIEIPSYIIAIWLINIAGRKPLTVYNFVLCGVACFLCAVVPAGGFRTAFAVAGKFGAAIAFIILFLYTTELFPTVVRNAALGSNSAAARVGGMLAPAVVLAGKELHSFQFPFIVFGIISIVAAFISNLLPETMNKPLMETFDDVENEVRAERIRPHGSDARLGDPEQPGDGSIMGSAAPAHDAEVHSSQAAAASKGFFGRLRALQGWARLDDQGPA